MPKVSVVVPVYGVEKYMEQCARSLFEQTLDDLEYIFVNDCTPDSSIAILERILVEYPYRKKQVRIINMPTNCKQAAVRKHGIIAATGDYLIHCDSDDWVEPDMYEKMYNAAIEYQCDVVVCDFVEEYTDRSVCYKSPSYPHDPKKLIAEAYKFVFIGSLWNKLVKRILYTDNNIYPYLNLNMAEDLGLICRLFVRADSLYQMRNCFYHYNRTNIGSITANKYSDKVLDDMLNISRLLREDLLSMDKERYKIYANYLCYSSRLQVLRSSFDDLKKFKETFPETNEYVSCFTRKGFPPKARLRYLLVKCHMAFVSILLFKLFDLYRVLKNK